MPKNKYKLQSVLDVRDRAKQEAMRHVAARRAQLAEAEAELARRLGALEDCRRRQREAREAMLREIEPGAEARRLVAHRTHLADLRNMEGELTERVEEQRAAVVRAEGELEQALAALVEASKEVQAIEKHREEWGRQERRVEQRREQKLTDEIGAIMHGRKRNEKRDE
ncbi:MAG TPA: flagellar FliJ family protein [Pyrinomonadaceae bacterium]|nr:flagellar FliJ family protein [Pyrinomonadaceae bacterium]